MMPNVVLKAFGASFLSLWAVFAVTPPTITDSPKQAKTPVYASTTHATMPQVASKPWTPTTSTPLPQAGNCEAYVAIAYHVGWPIATLDTLRDAMRLESGCDPYAIGDGGDSIGLLQIHQPSWCTPNSNWPIGWMQHYNLGICGDLFDPHVNLRVGLAIWEGWEGSTPGWHHWHALK